MECSRCRGQIDGDGTRCSKCREYDKTRKSKRITETHRSCCQCGRMKPHEEFKSDRVCTVCFINPKLRLHRYKKSARGRGYEWALSDERALELFSLPCHYCNKQEGLNGIDRQDNSVGYTNENCVPCCWSCNDGKGAKNESEFLEMCLKVTAHIFPWLVPFYSMWTACSSETKNC